MVGKGWVVVCNTGAVYGLGRGNMKSSEVNSALRMERKVGTESGFCVASVSAL